MVAFPQTKASTETLFLITHTQGHSYSTCVICANSGANSTGAISIQSSP